MWKGEEHFYGGCLLMVIVALLVSAAVLLPLFSNARQEPRTFTCAAHLNHWGIVLSLYAEDHGGSYPTLQDIPAME